MKAKITTANGAVIVHRDNDSGEREITIYIVTATAAGDGYVRIRDKSGLYPQVCEGLECSGSTLRASTETLSAVIRRALRTANRRARCAARRAH